MSPKQGWLMLIASLIIGILGCGKPEGPVSPSAKAPDGKMQSATTGSAANNQATDTPESACREFLEALRTGDDEKAAQMLSAVAREKAAALGRSVTPSASDTARFAIGKVKYIGDDGAQVESIWTDVDSEGKAHSDDLVWVLRREQPGWRIVGLAATIFPGEPPLVLNFEDPDEVVKKTQWAREEILRRADKENLQAKEQEKPENSMRR
jgi:hypothetical protein